MAATQKVDPTQYYSFTYTSNLHSPRHQRRDNFVFAKDLSFSFPLVLLSLSFLPCSLSKYLSDRYRQHLPLECLNYVLPEAIPALDGLAGSPVVLTSLYIRPIYVVIKHVLFAIRKRLKFNIIEYGQH